MSYDAETWRTRVNSGLMVRKSHHSHVLCNHCVVSSVLPSHSVYLPLKHWKQPSMFKRFEQEEENDFFVGVHLAVTSRHEAHENHTKEKLPWVLLLSQVHFSWPHWKAFVVYPLIWMRMFNRNEHWTCWRFLHVPCCWWQLKSQLEKKQKKVRKLI